jgi:hypothetical protein
LVIALVAEAVGWFRPLLGLSQLGFVVVDVVIAAVTAGGSARTS